MDCRKCVDLKKCHPEPNKDPEMSDKLFYFVSGCTGYREDDSIKVERYEAMTDCIEKIEREI